MLYGSYFSTGQFLDSVTYGPSGAEYVASCNVSVPHSVITCLTAPGTGRKNYWIVSVGSQVSDLSPTSTSYAAPTITSISPSRGPTNGGGIATIVGVNFGLANPSSRLTVLLNNLARPDPSPSQWAAWRAARLAGSFASVVPAVDAWLNLLHNAPIISTSRGASNESVTVAIPPGYGSAADVIVIVDGVPSAGTTFFSYDPPVITNLAPDRTNLSIPGTLHVWIDGSSMCSGTGGCGRVLFNGDAPLLTLYWTDTLIQILVVDPQSNTVPNTVQVRIPFCALVYAHMCLHVPFSCRSLLAISPQTFSLS